MSEQDADGGEPGDVVADAADAVLDEVHRLVTALEAHPDPAVGAQVTALLQGIDAIHRTALTHLLEAIRGMAGEAFVNRLTADPAIRLLLMSYELIAVDRRLLAEEALDAVRGHLHAHGVDVELLDVVGGVIYVRLHGVENGTVSLDGVKHDVEEALKDGLLGFQELVVRDREAAATATAFIPLGGVRRAHRPVYRRVLATDEVPPGRLKAVEVDGHSLLIANVEGEFYAVQNRCGDSPLPLEFSVLEGAELRCSWHGCRYDIRSGQRLDDQAGSPERGLSQRLAVFPVSVQDGAIRVAVGVEAASAPATAASREGTTSADPTRQARDSSASGQPGSAAGAS